MLALLMGRKPTIAMVGPGSLGSAMARALRAAGYSIEEIIHRGGAGARRASLLARKTGAQAVSGRNAKLAADIVWICVADAEIAACARELAKRAGWRGKLAFHSSGALSSGELSALRERGAAVASVHPMMTFVRHVRPELEGVTFAIEGDTRAARTARRIASDLGGEAMVIRAENKGAYHAFGAFTSPLIVATLALAERVAKKAGLGETAARRAMGPIVQQTLRNYLTRGPAGAFSGPLARGDLATVRRHLEVLRAVPEARAAYVALARSALKTLPVKRKIEIAELLK